MEHKEIKHNEVVISKEIHGKKYTMKTGWMAKQANGAVLTSIENTQVLGVATMSSKEIDADFFPLSVNYTAKFYAAGKIPGGYFRREAKPTDRETLTSRLIDRPLRPLFADGFRREVQIIPTVLSIDDVNPPDIVGMIASSAALTVSDIPFNGPIGAVRICMCDEKLIVNPVNEEIENSTLDIIVAGTNKAITMIEGDAEEVSEEVMLEAVSLAHEAIKDLVGMQIELREKIGKEKVDVTLVAPSEELTAKISSVYHDKLAAAMNTADKKQREEAVAAIYDEAEEALAESIEEDEMKFIKSILHDIEGDIVRTDIIKDEKRQDGRALDEIRPLDIRTGVLDNVHGSALFTRGQTQALAVSTLGTTKDVQRIDEMTGDITKNFFLHYNFPPYSVGETGRIGFTGRREIGHGMLAERSIARLLPTMDDFKYTIRIVSEILESNGSSSMATVCASSLSLWNAGIPLKKQVAGIAMGLVMKDDAYKILTDIQGLEDHLGDMDFKVAGTRDGITAFQLDIKVEGITIDIMREALSQAKKARLFILDKMYTVIDKPSETLSPKVPQNKTITIPEDRIRNVIGPGGKNIKAIVEETGSDIDINDDGTVVVFAANAELMQKTLDLIEQHVGLPKKDKLYHGTVKKVTSFGAFVELTPGVEGLCHISELSKTRVENIFDHISEGDKLDVKVLRIDEKGRVSLTHKGI
jgi:polyribonucleotide nucleotidyltransferase